MKKTVIAILILLFCVVTSTAQKPSLELTFTAIDSASHIQLDSIKVMNRTQGGDTVLYYPDTVLVLDYITGIAERNPISEGLHIFQNYPNPVIESTTISINVPEKGLLMYMVTDIMGRVIIQSEEVFEPGVHSFSYTPGGGEISFFTAFYGNSRESIKILHSNLYKSSSPQLSYLGRGANSEPPNKATETMQGFSFSLGDLLLYIGYTNGMESGINDAPTESDTLSFQFATNIPCPGIPTLTYEGQVYNTIQIFSQCWMKENLNVGNRISGNLNMTDNSIIEKYCYENDSTKCDTFGGLYQWHEMMQYVTHQGTQGICPPGWHIPTDEEFKILDGVVDSLYGIGNEIWDISTTDGGYDVGIKLKSDEKWEDGCLRNDVYNFSALGSGVRLLIPEFFQIRFGSFLWTSSSNNSQVWFHGVVCYENGRGRQLVEPNFGVSARCIKD